MNDLGAKEAIASFNKLYVVESLRADELHTGERLVNEVRPVIDHAKDLGLAFYRPSSRADFLGSLAAIWQDVAAKRLYPMLHIDAHGTAQQTGIHLANGDIVYWEELTERCRRINIECHNNLVVTTGLCFGLLSIKPVTIRDVTPFFALIGPETVVSVGEVDCFSSFYAELLRSADINRALQQFESMGGGDRFGVFLSEKLFIKGFVEYVRTDCRGKGRLERAERLLTEYVARSQVGGKLSLRDARRIIKSRIRPDATVFERMKARFLLSDHPLNADRFPSTFEEVVKLADRDER